MASMLQNQNIIVVDPILVEKLGAHKAMFLSQLHYWQQNLKCDGLIDNGKKYIYNTQKEWAKQLKCSMRTIRRWTKNLTEWGYIQVKKLSKKRSDQTLAYHVNVGIIIESCSESRSFSHADNVATSCGQRGLNIYRTETTTKITNIYKPEKFEKKSHEEKQPTDIANNMLSLWNKTFEESSPEMTQELSGLLIDAFHKKFNASLDEWYTYLELILTSKWIMSDDFTLKIEWALKHGTIDRLRRGELGVVKKLDLVVPTEESMLQIIDQLEEEPVIKTLRKCIVQKIGFAAYYSWFHLNATFEIGENRQIKMVAPNKFVKEYWETHFADLMKNFAPGN